MHFDARTQRLVFLRRRRNDCLGKSVGLYWVGEQEGEEAGS